MFSFLTDLGVYTPTRVLMGGKRFHGILPGGGPGDFPGPAIPGATSVVGRPTRVRGRPREAAELVGEGLTDMPENGVKAQPSKVRFL